MRRRFLVAPDSTSSEPFRTLRLAVEARAGTSSPKRVLFTSPRPGDGSSTVAANYAIVAALVQRPVLLIDADLRNPTLHEMFEVPREPGLVDVLRDRLDLWQVSREFPALGGLQLLTAGSHLPSPGDVAASPAMAELLRQAESDYEAVVIDSPPVLLAADASGLAAHSETDVVVVVNRPGRKRHAVTALRKLAATDANVLGLVVNRDGAGDGGL